MRSHRKGIRRSAIISIILGLGWLISSAFPAKALTCSQDLDQACTVVFGTYCQVTHRYPCFP